MLIPWTLPVEMSISFTKKLIDYLPKIDVPHDSKNLIDNMLVYLNLLIQKLTYDKYQYHARYVQCHECPPGFVKFFILGFRVNFVL